MREKSQMFPRFLVSMIMDHGAINGQRTIKRKVLEG